MWLGTAIRGRADLGLKSSLYLIIIRLFRTEIVIAEHVWHISTYKQDSA